MERLGDEQGYIFNLEFRVGLLEKEMWQTLRGWKCYHDSRYR